jgi:enoyl-CoA hydratase/carnithine racemase
MAEWLKSKPPKTSTFLLDFPRKHVLLITINRPHRRNSIGREGHKDGNAVFTWLDEEPSLRIAIVTGAGDKVFSAGLDLTDLASLRSIREKEIEEGRAVPLYEGGFMGLSVREGKKPIIAAVNGVALGGGFELCLNRCVLLPSRT